MTKAEYIEKYGEEAYKRYLEKCREYKKQHKEERKEYNKQYQQQHKEEIKEYQKQYNKQRKEKNKQRQRKKYCMFAYCIPEQLEQIENYELAKANNFKGWHIHHRMECVETGAVVNSSVQDLKDWGFTTIDQQMS